MGFVAPREATAAGNKGAESRRVVRESGDRSAVTSVETLDPAAPPVPPARATSGREVLILVPS